MWPRSVIPETVAGTATASRPTRAARSRNAHVAGAMPPTVAPVASTHEGDGGDHRQGDHRVHDHRMQMQLVLRHSLVSPQPGPRYAPRPQGPTMIPAGGRPGTGQVVAGSAPLQRLDPGREEDIPVATSVHRRVGATFLSRSDRGHGGTVPVGQECPSTTTRPGLSTCDIPVATSVHRRVGATFLSRPDRGPGPGPSPGRGPGQVGRAAYNDTGAGPFSSPAARQLLPARGPRRPTASAVGSGR